METIKVIERQNGTTMNKCLHSGIGRIKRGGTAEPFKNRMSDLGCFSKKLTHSRLKRIFSMFLNKPNIFKVSANIEQKLEIHMNTHIL